MPNDFRRQTAYKVRISELIDGIYGKDEDELNYIKTESGIKISRANIVAVVVSKSTEGSYESLTVDDGSGKIAIRIFDRAAGADVGDFVLIIGKPRQFGDEKYLIPEIVKKLPDSRWLELRLRELKNSSLPAKQETERKNAEHEDAQDLGKVLELIKNHDSGQGADINELVNAGADEKTITYLIQRGDAYEIRPGRLKILE